MSIGWLVARAKPGRENWAAENIVKQGCIYYLPKILERRGSLARSKSLFGPYIFVKTPSTAWMFLLSTFGVAGIVLFGETPATMRDSIIDSIRATEVDGLVSLPKWAPKDPEKLDRWEKNARLRIKDGPFSGHIGLYEGLGPKQREHVLLDFLGRRTSVLFAPELVEAA